MRDHPAMVVTREGSRVFLLIQFGWRQEGRGLDYYPAWLLMDESKVRGMGWEQTDEG